MAAGSILPCPFIKVPNVYMGCLVNQWSLITFLSQSKLGGPVCFSSSGDNCGQKMRHRSLRGAAGAPCMEVVSQGLLRSLAGVAGIAITLSARA